MPVSVPAWLVLLGNGSVSWWVPAGVGVLAVLLAWLCRYQLLVRFPVWLLRHTLYRVRVHGIENLPASGAALLVSNHVSHIDAGLIQAASRRPVRFLIWAPYLMVPGLRWLLRLARVIPVDSRAGPRAIIQALRTAGDGLVHGDLVAIFAEGGITRTGFLLPFQRGLEQVVKRSPAPIIPVCLDHVWGSIFSYQGGRFFWKWPRRVPLEVHVNIGKPLPPTATAFEVRQAIQQLSAESAIRRAPQRLAVHRQFVRMAVRHPFRSCLIDLTNKAKPILRYGETLVAAKILVRRLKPLLGDDRMVGLWLPPSAGGALANIVVALLGKTAVNLNYSVGPELVQSSIRQCGIKRILTSRLFTAKVPLEPGPGVDVIYLDDFRKSVTTWERLRTLASVLVFPVFVQERWILKLGGHTVEDLATVIFSSGSTGEPKGVMLTQGNIAANIESVIQAIDPKPNDRLLGILPFFHSFGYTVTLWVPLQVGASVVYHPNPLQTREIGELCRQFRSTIFLSTPTFLRSFIKRCAPGDFASLRLLWCGAEKLPTGVAADFHKKFGVLPLEGYGCTELSPVAAANVPDWQHGDLKQSGNKPGTIGQPLPGIAGRIVDRDTFEPLPPGKEGFLLIFGANVMKGYLGKEEMTARKIRDGWYITGDLAEMDDEGFITITGREERFAKVGGEMVPLERVEEEIQQILDTSERMVAVTAIPDPRKGERLIVLHLPLNGLKGQDISTKLGERGLPNLYIPGQRDFYEVSELPILGSGKLDLKKCKETALQVAGGG